MTESNDPLDQLRAANPVPAPLPSSALPTSGQRADALFKEITMTDPTIANPAVTNREFGPAPTKDQIAPRRGKAPRSKTGRRFALTGVAAATAAAVGFSVVALAPGSTTEAEAAMISAAQGTEAARAGTAIITVNADADGEQHEIVLTTAFDGSDLSATLDAADMGLELGGSPEVRIVDGSIFLSLGDGNWYSVDDPKIADLLSASGLPVNIRNDLSSGIVELVKTADNVEEVEPGHFRATVTVDDARRLAKDFPSLGLYTDQVTQFGADDLPAEVANQPLNIDLVLDDAGLIDVVTIGAAAVDPDSGEPATGSIRIDLNDLGTTQTIEAPANAQPMDLGSFLSGN